MNEKLIKALELLDEANALVQQVFPASDELYEIHNAFENLADEIVALENAGNGV